MKKVWLDDPLVCEKCGIEMSIIAFIPDRPAIEKILRHLGLWRDRPEEPPARSPPEVEIVRFDEDGVCLDQTQLL